MADRSVGSHATGRVGQVLRETAKTARGYWPVWLVLLPPVAASAYGTTRESARDLSWAAIGAAAGVLLTVFVVDPVARNARRADEAPMREAIRLPLRNAITDVIEGGAPSSVQAELSVAWVADVASWSEGEVANAEKASERLRALHEAHQKHDNQAVRRAARDLKGPTRRSEPASKADIVARRISDRAAMKSVWKAQDDQAFTLNAAIEKVAECLPDFSRRLELARDVIDASLFRELSNCEGQLTTFARLRGATFADTQLGSLIDAFVDLMGKLADASLRLAVDS